jgi:hypothetical protein
MKKWQKILIAVLGAVVLGAGVVFLVYPLRFYDVCDITFDPVDGHLRCDSHGLVYYTAICEYPSGALLYKDYGGAYSDYTFTEIGCAVFGE